MKMRNFALALVLIFSGCLRGPFSPSPSVPVEDDKSIVFPRFFERQAHVVGVRDEPYVLDGELLRALSIAANDFLPPGTRDRPCGGRQEAQRYRVIRQDDVFFIYIEEDHEYCGRKYPALDSGAKYAISKDGRILRRVFDGQPEEPIELTYPDGGPRGVPAKPGVVPGFEPIEALPSPPAPPESRDGGSSLSPPPAPGVHDGGSPLEHRDGGTGSPRPTPLPAPSSVPDGGSPPDAGSPGVP